MAAMAYFERTGEQTFTPTEHVRGAWGPHEQHVAPSLGLLAHVVLDDLARRRGSDLVPVRLSFDILGVMPMEEVATEVRVLRPGRTVELVEATATCGGRVGVSLRAWLLATGDTTAYAATELEPMPSPDELPAWDPASLWPGGFIDAAEVRRESPRPGRGRVWVRSDVDLLDEPVHPMAHATRLLDIANGMSVLADPTRVAFPNVDLTAHVFREPVPGWLGFDTRVSMGAGGLGVTSSVLHDEQGPYGTLAQALTVRPKD